jgi:hypothetical protein
MVHRGCGEHRLVGRQQHGRGKVAGQPLRHARQDVGSGGGDDHDVAVARQADMADLVLGRQVEQLVIDAALRQRADRQRRYEFLGRARQHAAHVRPALAQAADQVEAFVCRDPAADDQQYALAGQHPIYP